MKKTPVVKYTSYGNNFVIIDETITQVLSETEKSSFAYRATNLCFGIGSDNLLVIQPCRPEILESINHSRHYWKKLPDSTEADFIFRMFEPNGEEAFCCGNGLMCIANYLYNKYGIDSSRIMTEIPFPTPNIISIGTKINSASSWANMGHPKRVPPEIANPSILKPYNNHIDFIEEIRVNFRSHDLNPFTDEVSLSLSGYLVFTGEPHFVIFVDNGLSEPSLARAIFTSPTSIDAREKRTNFGSWLIHHIGSYVNKHYLNVFPAGINLNFVSVKHDFGEVEYRCFERGINRETLACGTGALAVSYVVRHLNIFTTNKINVVPHRYSWHEPEARIQVEKVEDGWLLNGNPSILLDGAFIHTSSRTHHDESIDVATLRRLELKNNLRKALEREEFCLHFQPQVGSSGEAIVGMEALLRWHNQKLGLVSPEEFIPIAEETGLIIPIGEWVLRQACAQAKTWQREELPKLRIAVNLSAYQVMQSDLTERVARILEENDLGPEFLELEFAENLPMDDIEKLLNTLHKLKAMGVSIAIDDFGTGYSNLSYLKQFPIDRLKIDRSLVANITSNPRDAAAALAAVSIAHSLNLSATAEGVETESQRVLLSNHGYDEMQGFLFGRPQPVDMLSCWFRKQEKNGLNTDTTNYDLTVKELNLMP